VIVIPEAFDTYCSRPTNAVWTPTLGSPLFTSWRAVLISGCRNSSMNWPPEYFTRSPKPGHMLVASTCFAASRCLCAAVKSGTASFFLTRTYAPKFFRSPSVGPRRKPVRIRLCESAACSMKEPADGLPFFDSQVPDM